MDPRSDRWFNALTATAAEHERYDEVAAAQKQRDSRWNYYERWIKTGAAEIADRVLRSSRHGR